MGFSLSDLPGVNLIDEGLRGLDDAFDFTGKSGAEAAESAAAIQQQAAQEAASLFDPFQALGQQGLQQAGILTDPSQQFSFLQNNPILQLAMDRANQQTLSSAAARGRLSADDTQQQFANNTLLTALPFLQQQQGNVSNLLNLGLGVAGSQGNLLTGGAAAQAGGVIGAQNARTAGAQNALGLLGSIGGFLGGVPSLPSFGSAPTSGNTIDFNTFKAGAGFGG